MTKPIWSCQRWETHQLGPPHHSHPSKKSRLENPCAAPCSSENRSGTPKSLTTVTDPTPGLRGIIANGSAAFHTTSLTPPDTESPAHCQQGLELLADTAVVIADTMAKAGEEHDSVVFFTEAHDVDVIEGGDQVLNAGGGYPAESASIAVERGNSVEDIVSDRGDVPDRSRPYVERVPPSVEDAKEAYYHLSRILKPPRNKGRGYEDAHLDSYTRRRLEAIQTMINLYTRPKSTTYDRWTAASVQAASSLGKGLAQARKLRACSKAFIRNHEDLPVNPFGFWALCPLDDEDLKAELQLHLQSIGKYVRAQDICDYFRDESIRERWDLEKPVSLATAKRWIKQLGYRWLKKFRGQYDDGHERDDVVQYRQEIFLPAWKKIANRMRSWDGDGQEMPLSENTRLVVVWFHDESTIYANDWMPSRNVSDYFLFLIFDPDPSSC